MTNDEVIKVLEERVLALNLYNNKTEYCKEEIKALCIAVETLKRIDVKIIKTIIENYTECDEVCTWTDPVETSQAIVNYLRGE